MTRQRDWVRIAPGIGALPAAALLALPLPSGEGLRLLAAVPRLAPIR